MCGAEAEKVDWCLPPCEGAALPLRWQVWLGPISLGVAPVSCLIRAGSALASLTFAFGGPCCFGWGHTSCSRAGVGAVVRQPDTQNIVIFNSYCSAEKTLLLKLLGWGASGLGPSLPPPHRNVEASTSL